jgi:DNA-binding SARP family transcriptional activator
MDDGSGSIAKITRPLLAGHYPRRRLFGIIDRARKRPALWVCGPPGSGKTTLVSSYVAQRRVPALWYRLDEGDADPASFFYYLELAARRGLRRGRMRLPSFTPDQRPAVGIFARRYFEALFSRVPPGSAIVFDDYQKLPPDAVLHTAIRDSLAILPARVSVILISRGQPTPAYARVRAAGSLELLGWRELRLSPAETKGIARLRWKGARDAASFRQLQKLSDGWAAGCVLLLEKAARSAKGIRKSPRGGAQEIFDYFASEVFETIDAPLQSFLLTCAHLPRMTAAMAGRLTGQARAARILAELARNSQFTEVRPGDEPVYEFHPLFREFLLSRGSDRFSERSRRGVKARAARILEQAGHPEEALRIYREIGDWRRFSRIVRVRAGALAAQGRTRALGEWLQTLPDEVLRKEPDLRYWRAVARLPTCPLEGRRDFEEAFRQFAKRKDRDGVLRSCAGVLEAIVYGPGTLKDLDPWFRILRRWWKGGRRPLAEETESRATCAMIKALSLRRPAFEDMESWAERAIGLSGATPAASVRFSALLSVAYCRFHGGDFPATALLLDSLRGLARKSDLSPLSRLNLCWLEAASANANGRHGDALKAVTKGLAFADATGVHLLDNLLAGHGALSALHSRDSKRTRRFLRTMAASLATAPPWEAAFFQYLAAWDALQRGETATAGQHADRGLALSEEVGNPWTEALARIQKALVLFRAGDVSGAVPYLAQARRMGVAGSMQFLQFVAFLAEAYVHLAHGDEDAALSPLKEGMRVGRERGYFDVYLWCPGLLEHVVAASLERGIEPSYARELIRRNGLLPDGPLAESVHWPRPLRLQTLGTFGVFRDERPLAVSRKVRQKPLLLLKALVALGGKEVPEEELTDILWPDAEGDLAHQSFATTLSRLRTMLGDERALSLRGSRLTLDTGICWVDALAFDALLARIDESLPDAGTPDGLLTERRARRAISLYQGEFLARESGQSWVVAFRERLRSKFLRAVAFLGRVLERDGRYADAVACYRKGIELDDVAEELYRRLMNCHLRAGQRAEALSAYRRCERTLGARLGIAPSPETAKIASEIARG